MSKIPKWFLKSKLLDLKTGIDHLKIGKIGDVEVVISRPYRIEQKDLIKMVQICGKENIKLKIKGKSNYPNKDTLSIFFIFNKENKHEEILENWARGEDISNEDKIIDYLIQTPKERVFYYLNKKDISELSKKVDNIIKKLRYI